MPYFFHHHLLHSHRLRFTEMNELYISLSLRALALGVGGIFVPLYLYDIGYSLALIALFYVFSMGVRIPLEVVAAKLVAKIGAKHTLTISYTSLFLHFVALFLMPYFPFLWAVAGVLLATEMALFWVSYHVHMSAVRSRKVASSQVGIAMLLRRVFMALGPLVGGVVASIHGVQWTLLLAAVCLASAAYPLFKTPDIRQNIKFKASDLSFSIGRDSLAHIAWQISGVAATFLWPLWLLLVLGDYSQIGLIIALSIIIGIGLTLWVGRLGDKGYNDQLLKVGSAIKATSHILRTASFSFPVAFAANLVNDFGDNFVQGPYTENFYEAADKGKRFLYIVRMNVVSVVGKVSGWLVFLVLAIFLEPLLSIQVLFILAALTMPAILWVSHRRD